MVFTGKKLCIICPAHKEIVSLLSGPPSKKFGDPWPRRYVMLQKSILSEPKWEEQAVVRGVQRPYPHRSDGTGYQYNK